MSPCTVVMLSVFYIAILKYLQENLKIMNLVETSFNLFSVRMRNKNYNA